MSVYLIFVIVSNDLLLSSNGSETSIAVLKDKQLVEFAKEKRDSEFGVGDLYLGKVSKVIPNLNAAFVNVGYEKDAFLHYFDLGPQIKSLNKYISEIKSGKQKTANLMYFKNEEDIPKGGKITDILKPGQQILVKIAKEPISHKGPRLSCEISIPGRYTVIIPFAEKVTISSKIKESEERERLKKIFQSIKPKNFGVIVRTAAKNVKLEELDRDLREQLQRWEDCFKSILTGEAPSKVMGELNRSESMLRDMINDSFSFDNIYVDDDKLFTDLTEFVGKVIPDKAKLIKRYNGKNGMFDHFNVTKQVKALFGRNVSLKSGGYLIIEHTEALHVIDVNSGNMMKSGTDQETSALETNLEAAEEIARQLRLRDMGGIIVVDFIDMQKSENRQALFEALKGFMKEDRAKHNVLPPSKIGLVQITRERVRPVLDIETKEVCPTCNGTGKVEATILIVDQIENALKSLVAELKLKEITVELHPFIEAYLTKRTLFTSSIGRKWEKSIGAKIKFQGLMSYGLLEYNFFDKHGAPLEI